MNFVTIEIGGIRQSVPEADVAQYLRAGYRRVDEKPVPVAPLVPPVDPTPEPIAPVADPVKSKKDK